MRPGPQLRGGVFSTLKILLILLVATAALTASEHRIAASAAPGFLTAQGAIAYGVGAEAEWFSPGRVSVRSDLYALVATSKTLALQQSYQAMLGIVYNFERSGVLAPFVGFQPGFGFASVRNGVADGLYIYPVMSPLAGVHLFINDRWHVSGHVRYVFGEMNYAVTGAVYLSEFRAGLSLGYFF
jgi:hypothetical protein